MASFSDKADRYVGGDQQDRDLLSSAEDKHYDLIDEKGDYNTLIVPVVHDATRDLIAKESEHNTASDPMTQSSCTLSTIMNTGDNHDDDGKIRVIKSSDSEVIIINEGVHWPCTYDMENTGYNVDSNLQNKEHINVELSKLPKVREYDPTIDDRLPETVTLLTTPDGGKLYLVGTAHFSIESQKDVSKIIQAVQPHIVAIELCEARIGILQLEEEVMLSYAKNINYKTITDSIKKDGFYHGLLYILLLRMAAHVSQQLGMPPGGEFRRAIQEAKLVPNCIVHLIDRPINVTMQRAIRSLSWWQTIKLAWRLTTMKDPITQEDVELFKQRSMLDELIAGLKEEFPVFGEVFIQERDTYLTNSLQLACLSSISNHPFEPARVVGIVGLGHTIGIIENWGKVKPTDIPPIMKIPPASLSGKILSLTIRASVLGAVIYIGYKVVAVPTVVMFQSLKSSVEGLLKIGTAQ